MSNLHLQPEEFETATIIAVSPMTSAEIVTPQIESQRAQSEEITKIEYCIEDLQQKPAWRWDPLTFVAFIGILFSIVRWIYWLDAATSSFGYTYGYISYESLWKNWLSLGFGTAVPLILLSKIQQAQAEKQIELPPGPPSVVWVGPLVEALSAPHRKRRTIAKRLLTRLLPALSADEADRIHPQHWKALMTRLQANALRDSELNQAILKALESRSDVSDLPLIESLAYPPAWWAISEPGDAIRQLAKSGKPGTRRAARLCLARIERRLERQTADAAETVSKGSETSAEHVSGEEQTPASLTEFDAMLATAKQEARREPMMRGGFLAASYLTIVPFTGVMTFVNLVDKAWPALIWAPLFGLATQMHRLTLSTKQMGAIHDLAACDDTRAVGPLSEALLWPDKDVQAAAKSALTRLLPRLQASDANLLNAKQRACLYRQLLMSNALRESEFLRAILKALEQIGDEKAAPFVERLSHSRTYAKKQRDVRVAAAECLSYLQNRSRLQQYPQTLLRPSGAEQAPATQLLRAAGATIEENPQTLLRAGMGPESKNEG